jgi:hypothetical protein
MSIFAVKKLNFISLTSGIDRDVVNKLKKEIEILKRLEHTHIVSYIGSEIVNQ